MKLCWLGWDGYGVSSVYNSMLRIIPCDLFVVGTINGQYNIDGAIYSNAAMSEAFKRIREYDVIFCDTYEFSIGDAECIRSFVPVAPWHTDEWAGIKARKILFDLESASGGQEPWYLKNKKYFDFVYSSNRKLSNKNYPCGFPEKTGYQLNEGQREIKCYFTGSNMNQKYRKEIAKKVLAKGGVVDNEKQCESSWLANLDNSVSYYATLAAPGCEPIMYGQKGKPYECAYYGARPIIEDTQYNDYYELAIIDKGEFVIEPLPARQLREWSMEFTWKKLLAKFLYDEGICV